LKKSVFAAVVDVEGVVGVAVVESICYVVVVVDAVVVDINYSIGQLLTSTRLERLEDFLFENLTIEENLSLDD
jgi:hypothetical protein